MTEIIKKSNVDLLSQQAQEINGDFVSLPEEQEEEFPTFSYAMDKDGDDDVRTSICPMDVEEDLCLVRRIRDGRMNLIHAMTSTGSSVGNGEVEVVDEAGFIKIL